jgi:RNA polymerase sigma factor (sigma-70 family)
MSREKVGVGRAPAEARVDLTERARAAAGGDKAAAREVLDAIADDVYELALRMLGHPADAEDAAQEILVIVLTHLGSFRGESAFTTWVYRVAANHLARVRRGRREIVTFEIMESRLRAGLREEPSQRPDPEAEALASELSMRCTEAMILSLDREHRIAHVLADILGLPGELCAEILEIDYAAFRKRVSRARQRLHHALEGWCGVVDPANPCRCEKQVDAAVGKGLIAPEDLYLTRTPRRPNRATIDRATSEMGDLVRVVEVLRGPSGFAAPGALVKNLRELLDSQRFEVLRS